MEEMINKLENKNETIDFFIEDNLFIPFVKKTLEELKDEKSKKSNPDPSWKEKLR